MLPKNEERPINNGRRRLPFVVWSKAGRASIPESKPSDSNRIHRHSKNQPTRTASNEEAVMPTKMTTDVASGVGNKPRISEAGTHIFAPSLSKPTKSVGAS